VAAASRRVTRRTLAGLVAALVLAAIAIGIGIYARSQAAEAVSRKAEAEFQKSEAEKQASLADAKTKEAETNLRETQRTESYFRAVQAKQAGADAVTAALLVLEGLPDSASADDAQRTRPFVNEAWHALYTASLGQLERAVLGGHTGPVRSAVFAPDGGRILTASVDKTARLWDRDGRPLAIFQGHTGGVNRAVFAPDGGRILTASSDNTARLWDRDGKPLATLEGHYLQVVGAVFAPDGDRILTASFDPMALLWEAFPKPETLVDRMKAEVPRCLTQDQRQRLFLAPAPPRWCIDMHKWPYDGTSAANP
jgi:WD domain, G-beta repeat